MVLVLLVACGCAGSGGGSDGPRVDISAQGSTETSPPADTWTQMATSPLMARVPGAAVWTGEEMVVVGGSSTTPCGTGSDCAVQLEPLADGAAYDPVADTWRRVSPSPVAFAHGNATWTGSEMLVVANRAAAGDADVLMSYVPSTDEWALRTPPPQAGLGDPVWTGDAWVFTDQTTIDGGRDWEYVPGSNTWDRLPIDPIGPAHDRRLVWTNEELILFASVFDVESEPVNGFWEAAALESASGVWRRLRDPEIVNNGDQWIPANGFVVNPTEGTTDEVSGEVHPFGGVLDVRTENWSDLPEPEPLTGDHRVSRTGFVGDAGGWVVTDHRLFDPETRRWHEVMPRPDAVYPGAAVWTGSEILTWGGYFEDDLLNHPPVLSATGFAYRPPDR